MWVQTYLPYLLVILGVVLGAVIFMVRRGKRSAKKTYRMAFGLGAVWVALGVIFQNGGIGALGGLFILLGAAIVWRGRLNSA